MQRSIRDTEASDDERVDLGRIHSQAMILNKHSPRFLERSKQTIIHDCENLRQMIGVQQQQSLKTQKSFHAALTRAVDASLATGLGQRERARALIAPQGPLSRVTQCFQEAEEELAAVQLQGLEETFSRDRAQTAEVLAAGKRVVARELVGGAVEGGNDHERDDAHAARLFDMGNGRKVGREVEDGLEVLERMVRKATKVLPVQ